MKKYFIVFIIVLILLFPIPQKRSPYGCEFGPCYYSYNSLGTIIIRNIAGVFGISILKPDKI